MKTTLLSAILASTLLVCAPATVLAQPAAASAPAQGAATKTVIDSSTRILARWTSAAPSSAATRPRCVSTSMAN